jgi:hypothetical protein
MRIAAVFAATVATAALAAPSALAARPRLPAQDGPAQPGRSLQIKPFEIIWTGDGSGLFAGRGKASKRPSFGRLHWSAWSATEGRGWGANWLNNCVPFCAAGRFTPYNVNLTVYRPRVLSGFKVFTRIKVHYTGTVPRGFKRTSIFTLDHNGKQFFWNFPT